MWFMKYVAFSPRFSTLYTLSSSRITTFPYALARSVSSLSTNVPPQMTTGSSGAMDDIANIPHPRIDDTRISIFGLTQSFLRY